MVHCFPTFVLTSNPLDIRYCTGEQNVNKNATRIVLCRLYTSRCARGNDLMCGRKREHNNMHQT